MKALFQSDKDANQSLVKYLTEIANTTPLPASEEVRLAKLIQKNDQGALRELTQANLRFVVSVAKEYIGQGLPLEDLINEGNLGLIKAAKRFDETRGFKFISYAVWWIRQSIMQALAEHSRVVRIPMNRVGMRNKIKRAYDRLEHKFERKPSTDEVAKELDMRPWEVSDTLRVSGKHMSLDAPFKADDEHSLLDVIHDEENEMPDTDLESHSLNEEVELALKTLKGREAEVVRLYFGLGTEHPLNLQEIGEKMNLSRERVRQIKEKAIRRLRHKSRREPLRAYLG